MNGALTHTWLRRVSDYCSGGVSATERAAVEAHLAECAECRQALVAYRHFDALAQSLLQLGEGAVGALPGYRPALQDETMITSDADRETGTTTTPPRASRARLSTLGAIAAVVLITILVGTLFALHRTPAHPATGTPPSTAPFVHVVSTSRQVLAGDATPTVATCPADEVALSGGWDVPAAGSVLASHRMGNGWGIVVQAPTGSGVPVTASVACLAHVPGATVQELSSSVTLASETSIYNHVDCPRSVSGGVVGGGFSTSSPHLAFRYFFRDQIDPTWVMTFSNSGPSAATSTVFVECFTASGVGLTPFPKMNTTIPQGGAQTITAVCPQGSFASGGGFEVSRPQQGPVALFPPVRILGLAPASTARGWSADLSAVGGATTVDVLVMCLSVSSGATPSSLSRTDAGVSYAPPAGVIWIRLADLAPMREQAPVARR
jgi:hypothetical protein